VNFNPIAPYYDRLAALVFGSSIRDSQIDVFSVVPPFGRVLIFGGGTGWIIPHIFRHNEIHQVVYIEASSKMLDLAQKAVPEIHPGTINFIHGDETSVPDEKYDFIITNFVLDCFSEPILRSVICILKNHLNEGGRWYFSDFKKNPFMHDTVWQYFLLGLMRKFFTVLVNLESKTLYDFDQYFADSDLTSIYSRTYCRDFISTKVWC